MTLEKTTITQKCNTCPKENQHRQFFGVDETYFHGDGWYHFERTDIDLCSKCFHAVFVHILNSATVSDAVNDGLNAIEDLIADIIKTSEEKHKSQ